MYVATAGSGESAVGSITAENAGTVYGHIDNGYNQTLMALYTIPAGYNGYVIKGRASVGQGKAVEMDFYARTFGGVFRVQHHFHCNEQFHRSL